MKFVLITLAQLLVSLIIVFPLIYYDVPRRTILFHNTNDNFPPIMILILHLITYYLVPLFEHILTLKGGGMVGGKVFSQDLVKDRIKYLRWEMLEGFVAIAIAIAFSSINHVSFNARCNATFIYALSRIAYMVIFMLEEEEGSILFWSRILMFNLGQSACIMLYAYIFCPFLM